MRTCIASGWRLSLVSLAVGMLFAQAPPPLPPPPGSQAVGVTRNVMISGQGPNFQFIASEPAFLGTPVIGAPYSAETVNETTLVLGDGTRIQRTVSSRIARDSEGRTRQEQTLPAIGPVNADGRESRTQVTISDPVNRKSMILDPKAQTARVITMPPMPPMPPVPPTAGAEPRRLTWESSEAGSASNSTQQNVVIHRRMESSSSGADSSVPPGPPAPQVHMLPWPPIGVIQMHRIETSDNVKVEDLGERQIEGVNAKGTRRTATIPTGAIGNDRPIVSVTEEWASPELKVVLLRKTRDPQIGEITFKLTNLSRSEPLKELFEIPAGYTVVEPPPQRQHFDRKVTP